MQQNQREASVMLDDGLSVIEDMKDFVRIKLNEGFFITDAHIEKDFLIQTYYKLVNNFLILLNDFFKSQDFIGVSCLGACDILMSVNKTDFKRLSSEKPNENHCQEASIFIEHIESKRSIVFTFDLFNNVSFFSLQKNFDKKNINNKKVSNRTAFGFITKLAFLDIKFCMIVYNFLEYGIVDLEVTNRELKLH